MNLASHARGLLAELAGSVRMKRDNAEDVRAELRATVDAARKVAIAEQAALPSGDPERDRYASLLADLDKFQATDKPGKQTAAAPAAPEQA